MKIGVLADTHIPDRASDIPLEIIKDFSNVDLILHAGDLTNIFVLDKLKKIAEVKAVWGNMDSPEVKAILPEKEIINCSKYKIGLFHGVGAPQKLIEQLQTEFKNIKVDVIVFGHSHSPVNKMIGKTLFFNPGSPTDKIFSSFNSYGILEINDTIKGRIIRLG